MRRTLLTTAALLNLATLPALAQSHEPGTGMSGPASARASNVDAGDTRSAVAPHLPLPPGARTPWGYLHSADIALSRHRTGEAQQALEMAETRFLDRSMPVDAAGRPIQGAIVNAIGRARQALGHGDIDGARTAIHVALSQQGPRGHGPGPQGGMGMNQGPGPEGMDGPQGMAAPQGSMNPGMADGGAGPTAGPTAGATMGGGPAGAGTADSAGGAR